MASNKRIRGVFEKVKGSNIWWIRYTDKDGKLHREKAGTRGMAIRLYQKRKMEVLQGRKLPESLRKKPVLVSDLLALAAEHIETRYHGQRLGCDGRDYRYSTLNAVLGNRAADSVTGPEIERALSKLAEERGWQPASYNRHRAFLSLAWRLGIESGKVQSNPVRLAHRRREDNGRIRWLSAEEETKLRAVLESDYPDQLPAFELALHTGMRLSEQYGLQWRDVDLERRQIVIPRSKNGDTRYVPLDDTAVGALLRLKAHSDGSGPVMVAAKGGHGVRAGQPLKTPKQWFRAACEKAGVKDFSWHCLRHSFASRLVMAGVGLRTVQELMGHRTISMTCRYAHLSPNYQAEAVRRLDGWGTAKNQVPTDTKTATSAFEGSETPSANRRQVLVQ